MDIFDNVSDPIQRIRAVDWSSQPEATVSSQLIMPVLMLLGYGAALCTRFASSASTRSRTPPSAREAAKSSSTTSRLSTKKDCG